MIQVISPGDRTNIVHREVMDIDKRMYPERWKAFKEHRDQDAATGTLLSDVTWIKGSQRKEADYFKIRTVEQLAAISDGNLQRLGPGWIELRALAQSWLKKAKDDSHMTKMQAELAQRDSLIDALKKQLDDLASRVDKQAKGK